MKRLPLRASAAAALALILAGAPADAAPKGAPAAKGATQGSTLLPGASNHEPINISADKLNYFDKQQKAIYSGNVVVIQGDTRLKATVLTIFFDNKQGDAKAASGPALGSNSGVRKMEGKGPIVMTNKDQVGTGDSLLYDKLHDKFYLFGNVALSQGDNVTRGDKLDYDLSTGQAVVTSKGRVHSLIIPKDDASKPGAQPPAASGAAAR
ncbi:lipopolysaccharide transport periplasmic protein LptA [Rhodoblastus sp.]|uniref:lipopolysaccharide transport periplasmic protein LptA n=1 Tax=Rhodoblastus sp. TaxID=1962975 RepID=UPI003F9E536A